MEKTLETTKALSLGKFQGLGFRVLKGEWERKSGNYYSFRVWGLGC